MELYLKLLAAPLLEHHKARIFGRGDNPVNFVSQRDVAAFVELALTDSRLRGETIDVGGPENLSVNQLVHRFEELTGAKGGEQHIPLPMLRAMSVVTRPFNPTLARQAKAAVHMDTTDMAFDDRATARSYPSIRPTNLEEVVRQDFERAA
jgi:nucleoside-diphosphate-sugar epimerase